VNADLDRRAIGLAVKQQEVAKAKGDLQKELAVGAREPGRSSASKTAAIAAGSYKSGWFKQQWGAFLKSTAKSAPAQGEAIASRLRRSAAAGRSLPVFRGHC
jgi:hypothetical protein